MSGTIFLFVFCVLEPATKDRGNDTAPNESSPWAFSYRLMPCLHFVLLSASPLLLQLMWLDWLLMTRIYVWRDCVRGLVWYGRQTPMLHWASRCRISEKKQQLYLFTTTHREGENDSELITVGTNTKKICYHPQYCSLLHGFIHLFPHEEQLCFSPGINKWNDICVFSFSHIFSGH